MEDGAERGVDHRAAVATTHMIPDVVLFAVVFLVLPAAEPNGRWRGRRELVLVSDAISV